MRTDKRGNPLPRADEWRMYRWALLQSAELIRQAIKRAEPPADVAATLDRLAQEAWRYEREARKTGPKPKRAVFNPIASLGEPPKQRGRPRNRRLISDEQLLLACDEGRRYFGHASDVSVIRLIVDRHLAASTSLRRQGSTREKLIRSLKRQASEARRRVREMGQSATNSA